MQDPNSRSIVRTARALLLTIATVATAATAADARSTDAKPQGAEVAASQADRGREASPRSAMQAFLEDARARRWVDAASWLDLSQLAPENRIEQGPELARELKHLLDESLWIDLDALSDEPHGREDDGLSAGRDLVGTVETRNASLPVYLDRVTEADGARSWRIAAPTLKRVPSVYAASGPAAWTRHLPPVLVDVHLLEVALWQWLGLLLLAVVAWLGAWMAAGVLARVSIALARRSRTTLDDEIVAALSGPARALLGVAALRAGLPLLRLAVPAHEFLTGTCQVLVVAGCAWAIFRMIDLFASVVRDRLQERGRAGATHLVPIGSRTMKVAVAVVTLLAVFDTFGFDVTAILAGLGVGGLAVALAAQKTVENIFGGVSVLIDQPVRPGEFCRFGDSLGTVEDIGLRSTRVRTLDRTVVTVPNAEFASMRIENFAPRDRIRLISTLGLRYETSGDQLRHVLLGLRRLLIAHPKVAAEPQRVRFVGFGPCSLDVEMFAYVATTDFNEFLAVREDIFLRVMEVLEASGTGFAFPSSTMYLARDAGIDAERRRAAEAEVRASRERDELMFPDFTPEEVAALDSSLDWPPHGAAARRT